MALDRRLPHAVVGHAVQAWTDGLLGRRQARVEPRPDRRRAEEPRRVRLRAQPLEERPVPADDVVRVEAVEARRLRPSDERRVAEDAHAVERSESLRPRARRISVGVVDVEVGESALRRGGARCPRRRERAFVRDTARRGSRPRALAASRPARRAAAGRSPASRSPTTRRRSCPTPALAISRICAATIFAFDDEYRPRLGKYSVERTGVPSRSTYQCAQRPSFVGVEYHG